MTIEALLGIDLGTTRVKAVLIGADGTPLGSGRAALSMWVEPSTGLAEQDPDAWWRALRDAVAEATDGGRLEPAALCVVGHGPTLTATDADGVAVRPAITWLDSRAGREQADLEAATGLRGWALGVLPAARWMEVHDPRAAARTRWYLNAWEALALRLTGRAATTVIAGAAELPRDSLATSGLDIERIAAAIAPGESLGGLTSAAASHLGLRAGTPVVAGMVDAFASFHGAGMLRAGDAIDVGGAAGGFGVYAATPAQVPGSFTSPAPLPGLWSVGGAMAATGAALDWFARDVLGGSVAIDELIPEAARVEAGAGGLVFLPYLAGERSPIWDPKARGAFVGLTLAHGRAEMTRAILEAAALALRHVAQPIIEAGLAVEVMRACGGPARSDAWNQIKADVTGFRVAVPRSRETAAVGAAILAAVGAGILDRPEDAIRAMAALDRTFEPDAERARRYDEVYAAYLALNPAISPVLDRAAARAEARATAEVAA